MLRLTKCVCSSSSQRARGQLQTAWENLLGHELTGAFRIFIWGTATLAEPKEPDPEMPDDFVVHYVSVRATLLPHAA